MFLFHSGVRTGLLTGLVLMVLSSSGYAQKKKKNEKAPAREIRVAVFDIGVQDDLDVEPATLNDQVVTILSTMTGVSLVNRDQLEKVANEQQIALSGLVESRSAVKLGKFVSAQYVLVGRASQIGDNYYLVLKIVDVETTVQSTVAAKSSVEKGISGLVGKLQKPLTRTITSLQRPKSSPEATELAELKKLAKPFEGKVVLVTVAEEHLDRPLKDPAAQMRVAQRLRSLGFVVIMPAEPVSGWKQTLLETGRYGKKDVDYLLEGDGVSAFAARLLQGLTSCRSRVELRLIAVPGREVTVIERATASGVDLVEALASKKALEEAGELATDALLRSLADLQTTKKTAPKQNANE